MHGRPHALALYAIWSVGWRLGACAATLFGWLRTVCGGTARPDQLAPLLAGDRRPPTLAAPAWCAPTCRAVLLAGGLFALLGVAARQPSPQSIMVTPTTGTYPGAPRSVQVLDVTLPSGQHLWFDRDLCRTFAWYDTDDLTTLASPVLTGARWPVPDITVYRGYPSPYSDQLGGVWATDWGSAWQPHFQGYTTTATSVTFTCDHASVDGNDAAHRYTATIT
ncbi:MAG TPA: hypothetical protein VII06_16275, partial [Chloroflexota bacterium]